MFRGRSLRIWRNRIIALVLFLAGVLLLIWTGIKIESLLNSQNDDLVREKLEEILNGKVSFLESPSGDVTERMIIKGIRLVEQRPDPFLRFFAKSLIFEYDLVGLVTRSMPLNRILINEGMLKLNRTQEEGWDMDRMFRNRKSMGKSLYIPSISILGSEIKVRDGVVREGGQTLEYDICVTTGEVSQARPGDIRVDLQGYYGGEPSSRIFFEYTRSPAGKGSANTGSQQKEGDSADGGSHLNQFWAIRGQGVPLNPFGAYIEGSTEISFQDGSFDFSLTTEARPDKPRSIHGQVEISRGVVRYKSYGHALEDTQGKIGFSEDGWALGGLKFRVGKVPFEILRGGTSRTDLGEKLDMKIRTMPTDLGAFLALAGVNVEALGSTVLSLDMKGYKDQPEYYGEIRCQAGKIWGLEFSEGFILFSRHDSRIDIPQASLKSYGGMVTATGGAEVVGKSLPFRMNMEIGDIDLQDLCGSFPFLDSLGIRGKVEADIELQGDLSNRNLKASGRVGITGATFMNLSWDSLSFKFDVSDGILHLGEVSLLEGDNSPLRCKGFSLDLGEKVPTYSIEVELSEVPLGSYLKMVPGSGKFGADLGGVIEKGTLILSGKGFSSLCEKASADLQLRDLALGRAIFESSRIQIGFDQGVFSITGARLSSDYCDLDISGNIGGKDQETDLRFLASNVNLVKALDAILPWIAGKISPGAAVEISGRILGAIREPRIEAMMNIPSLDVAGKRITGLTLKASAQGETLEISSLMGSYEGFGVDCSGTLNRQGSVDVKGRIETFPLSRLTSFHPALQLDRGTASGEFSLRGQGKKSRASLKLKVEELFHGSIGPLSGSLELSGEMPDFGSPRVSGDFYLGNEGQVSIATRSGKVQIKGSSIGLSALGLSSIRGTGGFQLTGKASGPFSGSIEIRGFGTGLGNLGDLSSDLEIDKGILRLSNGRVPEAGKFYGTLDTKSMDMDLTFLIKTGEKSRIFDFAGLKGISFESLTGKAIIKGQAGNPSINLTAAGKGGLIQGFRLGKTLLEMDGDTKLVRITRLESRVAGGVLSLAGQISGEPETSLALSFKGSSIPMSRLPGLTGIPGIRPSGLCDFKGWIRGPVRDPGFSVEFTARNPLGGFSSVSGTIIYSKGLVLIRNISFGYQDQELRVVGKIPWDIVNSKPSDKGEMEIVASMEKGDLSAFLPENSLIESIQGTVDLSLRIWGDAQAPKLKGRASVTGGYLKPFALLRPIPINDTQVSFGEEGIEFTSGKEMGALSISGGIRPSETRNLGADIDLELRLPEFFMRSPQGFAPSLASRISVTGKTDCILTVKGPAPTPEIKGVVMLENGILDFPLTGMGEFKLRGMKGIKTTVTVAFSKNCWYRNNMVSAELDGSLDFDIQEDGVGLTGKVDILRGKINYLSNDFDIMEGHAEFRSLGRADEALTRPAALDQFDLTTDFDVKGSLSQSLIRVRAPRHKIDLARETQEQIRKSDFSLYVKSETRIKGIDIYLSVSGENGNFTTNLYSDPPQDQAFIYSLITKGEGLTVNSEAESDSRDALNLVGAELTNTIWKQFSTNLAKNFNLSEFTIKSSVLTNRSVQKPVIHLGKYLNEDLYFSYSRTFAENEIEVMGLEYRLRRKLILDTELKKDEDTRDLSLGLKFKRTF